MTIAITAHPHLQPSRGAAEAVLLEAIPPTPHPPGGPPYKQTAESVPQ